MKNSLLLILLASFGTLSCTAVHARHHNPVVVYGTTDIVVHDYAYDYGDNQWVQVNTYVDTVDCHEAQDVIAQIDSSGFHLVVSGPSMCPSRVEYSVHHNILFAPWVVYTTLWNSHHYAYHHQHTLVGYHRHVSYNTSHRHSGFYHRYSAHGHYKHQMRYQFRGWKHKTRYTKWRKSHGKHGNYKHHGSKWNANKHNSRRGYRGSKGHSSHKKGNSSYKNGKKKYGKSSGKRGGKRGKRGNRRSHPRRR